MHVRSYIILWSGEGLTSFNIDNSANFLGEKKKKNGIDALRCFYFLRIHFKSNLVLSSSVVLIDWQQETRQPFSLIAMVSVIACDGALPIGYYVFHKKKKQQQQHKNGIGIVYHLLKF